jgi:hypothetical protein
MLLDIYSSIVENSVKRVWEKLQNCSYYFITESDFQSGMMRYISEELESSKLLNPTEYNLPWNYGKSTRSRWRAILHSEYPRTSKSVDRFDIVFLDDSSMKSNIEEWNQKKILIAIELKYGWGLNEWFLVDIDKLRRAISSNKICYGVAILLSMEDDSEEKLKSISEQAEKAKSDKIRTYIITPTEIIANNIPTKFPE